MSAPKRRRIETALASVECPETQGCVKDLQQIMYSDGKPRDKSVRKAFLRMKTKLNRKLRRKNSKIQQLTAVAEEKAAAEEKASAMANALQLEVKALLKSSRKADKQASKMADTIEELKAKLKTAEEEKEQITQDAETEVAKLEAMNEDLEDKLTTAEENKDQMELVIGDLRLDNKRLEKENLELKDAKKNWQRQQEERFCKFAKSFLSPQSLEMLAPEKEESVCVICHQEKPNHAVNPCGHLCLCSDCKDIVKEECPLCRVLIQSTSRIYHA